MFDVYFFESINYHSRQCTVSSFSSKGLAMSGIQVETGNAVCLYT